MSKQESGDGGRTAVVLGGTQGIGREIVTSLASKGSTDTIAQSLGAISSIDDLIIPAIERDANTIADYNIVRATRLVTLKLVGYAEAIHALHGRFNADASVVLFGGLALERPYPGSTTVSTVNGGIVGLVHSLACELAPVRVNAIHPGIIGDSPFWENKDNSHIIARTPLGRLVTMQEIVGAVEFLLGNTGINGVNLAMDGGWLLK